MMKILENVAASFLTKWLKLMIQKKNRRGKWSVELHWTVLEEVSATHMTKTSANVKINTGGNMEGKTQQIDVSHLRCILAFELNSGAVMPCVF